MTWASGIAAITLFVEDVSDAKVFYRDVLELPVHFADDDSVVFKIGETLINLLAIGAAPEVVAPATPKAGVGDPPFVLTVRVADVDAVANRIVGLGATLLNGPIDRPWGVRTACFRDPAGYVWEIAA